MIQKQHCLALLFAISYLKYNREERNKSKGYWECSKIKDNRDVNLCNKF